MTRALTSGSMTLLAFSAVAWSVKAQDEVWNSDTIKGESVDRIGDVNGDGVEDVIVGERLNDSAAIHSGLDGSLIERVLAPAPPSSFGDSVIGLPDIDSDGVSEFAVGAPGDLSQGNPSGAVYVYSGRDRSILRRDGPAGTGGRFGQYLVPVTDQDSDGVTDYLVIGSAFAHIRSSADGTILRTFFSPGTGLRNPTQIRDWDGDGVADYLFGGLSGHQVWVYLYSGGTGALLHTIDGDRKSGFGAGLASIGDANGDGFDEFVVGAPFTLTTGWAYVYDGASLTVLKELLPVPENQEFGESALRLGDLNGDGFDEFVLGDGDCLDNESDDVCFVCGSLWIYSGATLELMYHEILSRGGGGDVLGSPMADVNGDGLPEIVALARSPHLPGVIVTTTNDLFLDGYRKNPESSDKYFSLRLAEADPTALGGIFVIDIDGSPVFQQVVVQRFGADQRILLETNDSTFAPWTHVYTFLGFSLDPDGTLRVSNPEVMDF